jgi:hypothetical protein
MARPRAAAETQGGLATYRATQNVYVDERYIFAGELFTTAAPKGATWEEVNAAKPDQAVADED